MNFLLLNMFVIGASLGYIAGMMTAWKAFTKCVKSACQDAIDASRTKGPWE